MLWVYTAAVILTLFICLLLLKYNGYLYYGYKKPCWTENEGILMLLSAISLILLGFAAQINDEKNKKIGPLLCLNLIFIILWLSSMTCIEDFDITLLSSIIIFVITITMSIILFLNGGLLIWLSLPFLFISLMNIYYSYIIVTENPPKYH